MRSTLHAAPEAAATPPAGRNKKRLGVVFILVAMLLLAYSTIAILRSTLLSPTQEEPAPDTQEQVDQ